LDDGVQDLLLAIPSGIHSFPHLRQGMTVAAIQIGAMGL